MTHPPSNATPIRGPRPDPLLSLSGSPSHGLSFPAATQFGCFGKDVTNQSTCRFNSTRSHSMAREAPRTSEQMAARSAWWKSLEPGPGPWLPVVEPPS
ncbi:hypothetical protein FPOAC1_010459 [Fusarium poae]|uniref:hypothetical protein n=1 Tax=Fusarium poae TaxID=36050 RepID=UPI001CEB32AF|nr:hypothetical protein FPOAC1_010459 [Fusarium poae]KAG8665660.1 hypothetical protein FPOAC1_010459 [Fusarium poae]